MRWPGCEVARLFARHLGSEHHEKLLVPGDMLALADLGKYLDEPNSDWSCLPVYMLSKLAREQVTVAVSGDGGDEMFGGYTRYAVALAKQEAEPEQAGPSYYDWGLLALDEKALAQFLGIAEVPQSVRARLLKLREEMSLPSTSLLDRMRKSDVDNYLPGAVLPKVDRMSMQHSLEVRTPFLSIEMARFAERLPQSALCGAGWSKRILREVAYRYLPRELVDRPKVGFGLPNLDWARDEIRSVAQRLLGSTDSHLRRLVGGEPIDVLLSRPKATHRLWALAMLESWFRHHPASLTRIAAKIT
jgi:asparagine synthetase B (glutamine-hydrolysing)